MVGGMITAPLLSMFVIPAAYFLLRGHGFRTSASKLPVTSAAAQAR
jgi:Cu(I)/Ag(I) efflux system membrane protein CusA/SilA